MTTISPSSCYFSSSRRHTAPTTTTTTTTLLLLILTVGSGYGEVLLVHETGAGSGASTRAAWGYSLLPSTFPLTWDQARAACEASPGAMLARVEGWQAEGALDEYLKELHFNDPVWLANRQTLPEVLEEEQREMSHAGGGRVGVMVVGDDLSLGGDVGVTLRCAVYRVGVGVVHELCSATAPAALCVQRLVSERPLASVCPASVHRQWMLVNHLVTSTPPSPSQTNVSVDGLQICHHHRLARAPCHTQGGWQRALCPQDSMAAKHHKYPKKAHKGHQQQPHGGRGHLARKKPYASQIPDGINLEDFLHQKHKKRSKRLAKVEDIHVTSEENAEQQPVELVPSSNKDMEVAALAKPQSLNLDEIESIMQTFTNERKSNPREKEQTHNPPGNSKHVTNNTVRERGTVVDEGKLQVVDEQNLVDKNRARDTINEVEGVLQKSVTTKPVDGDDDLPHPSQSVAEIVDSTPSVYVSQISYEDGEQEDVTVSSNTMPQSDLPEKSQEDKQIGHGVQNVDIVENPVENDKDKKTKAEEPQKPDEAEADMEEPQTSVAEPKMEDPPKPSESDKEEQNVEESQQSTETGREKDRPVLTVGVGPIFVQDALPENKVIEATEGKETENTTPTKEERAPGEAEGSLIGVRIKSSSKTITDEDEENFIIFPTEQTEAVTSARKPRLDDNVDTNKDTNSDDENVENEGASTDDNSSGDHLPSAPNTASPKSSIIFPEADNSLKEPGEDTGLEEEEEEEQEEEEEEEEDKTNSSPAVASAVEEKHVKMQNTNDEETAPEDDSDKGTITDAEKSSGDKTTMDDDTDKNTMDDDTADADQDPANVEEILDGAAMAQPPTGNQGSTSQVDTETESTVDPSIADTGDMEMDKGTVMDKEGEKNSADTTTESVNDDGKDESSAGEMQREPKAVEVDDQPDLSNDPNTKQNEEEMPEDMAEAGEALNIPTVIPKVEDMEDKLSIPDELIPSKDPTADKDQKENPSPDQDSGDVPQDSPKRKGHQGLLAQIFKGIFG